LNVHIWHQVLQRVYCNVSIGTCLLQRVYWNVSIATRRDCSDVRRQALRHNTQKHR
jgi:hypothetical protein